MRKTRALIMAAGKGSRMGSNVPKPLITVFNKTIIESIVEALEISEIEKIGIVVNPNTIDQFKEVFGNNVDYIIQEEQKGTGHAVMVAKSWLNNFDGNLIVTVGDTPLITKDIFNKLLSHQLENNNTCTMLSTIYEQETPPYGRIVRNSNNKFVKMVEEVDTTEEEFKIKEVGTSQYCFDVKELFLALEKTRCDNGQNEYYLCDVLEIFTQKNLNIDVIPIKNPLFLFGVNTKEDIKIATDFLKSSLKTKHVTVSVPGRICLFGEHQDYLNLPVITAGIDLRVSIKSNFIDENKFIINLPDINSKKIIPFEQGKELAYQEERDYFRSAYNILLRRGLNLKGGINCTITGKIPINSGTSSSSALMNCWIKTLIEYDLDFPKTTNQEIANLSYISEVIEFKEPGGMMDQYATAVGGVQFMEFADDLAKLTALEYDFKTFVLGDSKEPKDTKFILSNVKDKVLTAVEKIKEFDSNFSVASSKIEDITKYKTNLTEREFEVLHGAILNKQITYKILDLFKSKKLTDEAFGTYLSDLHTILDEKLHISTPKINRMIRAAIDAGAFGGKINGSGGGGCMFVYAPQNPEKIVESIKKEGGNAYIIKVGKGLYKS